MIRIAATIVALVLLSVIDSPAAIAQQPRQTAEPPLASPSAVPHAAQPAHHGGERTHFAPLRNTIAFIREHKPLRAVAGNVACRIVCRVRGCARGR